MQTMQFKFINNYPPIILFLLSSLLSFSVCAGNEVNSFLTQKEYSILKKRIQQKDSHIIQSKEPKELSLLKSRSRILGTNAPHLNVLLSEMRKAVIANNGLGLAAVQIGIPVRVVLLKKELSGKSVFKAYLNPVILYKSSATEIFREACLSLPIEEEHLIRRAIHLKISYQTEHGQSAVENFTDLDAAIFQQEMDHLNGILIRDYIHVN